MMDRRTAVKAAALSGATAFMLPSLRGQEPESPEQEFNAEKDRAIIMESGMTAEEADCWAAAADVAGKFFALPELHEMDAHEVAHAVHVIQNKLLGRPTYRRYRELWER